MNDDMYCCALVSGANLSSAMRLNVEGIARNTKVDREITMEGLEDAILRMKSDEIATKAEVNECSEYKDDQSTTQEEDVNWTTNTSRGRGGRGRYRGRPWQNNPQRKRTCYICDDPNHFASFCPDNPKKVKKEESTLTAFMKEKKSNLSDSSDDIFFMTKKQTKKSPK